MTAGIVAQIGRVLDGEEFDQTTVTACPGSSGGGVFKRDGLCVGILTQGVRVGDNFNFIVPVRRIRTWAKSAGVEWAMDDAIAMPTPEALRNMPVEGAGVSFGGKSDPAPARGNQFYIVRLGATSPLRHPPVSTGSAEARGR